MGTSALLGHVFRLQMLRGVEAFARYGSVGMSTLLVNEIFEHHLIDVIKDGDGNRLAVIDQDEFSQAIRPLLSGSPIFKVKLYDLDGKTLFSTNPDEIGKLQGAGNLFDAARAGNVGSNVHLGGKDDHDEASGEEDRAVVETYVPIRRDGGAPLPLIFEIYYDVNNEIAALTERQMMVTAIILAVMLIVYFLQNLLSQPMVKLIHAQEKENARLRATLDGAPFGVFIADPSDAEKSFLYRNAALEGLTGGTLARNEDIASSLERGAGDTEWSITDADGGQKWLQMHLAPTGPESEGSGAYLGFVHDITDRVLERRRTDLLAKALEQSSEIIELTDAKARYIYVNPAFEAITGYSLSEIAGKTPASVLRPKDSTDEVYQEAWRTLQTGQNWKGEFVASHKDGHRITLLVSVSPVRDETGAIINHVAVKRDITEHVRLREKLRLLSRAIDQSPISVIITDIKGVIEYVNPCFERTTGYSSAEAIGQNPAILRSGHTAPEQYAELWSAISAGQEWRGEFLNKRKDGSTFWEYASISPVRDADGQTTHYLAVKEDISLRKAYEEQLLRQANFDSLTGLPNRVLAQDRLNQAIAHAKRSERMAIVMLLDLDDFKKVNDTLGHEAGDELLKEAAKRFLGCIRESDTVARLGGDEFLILLEDVKTLDEAETVAEKLLAACVQPFFIAGRELVLAASLGLSIYPSDDVLPGYLIRNADAAMYRAKKDGKGSLRFFTPEINRIAQERLRMEELLRQALDKGEIEMHYQPLIEISTGKVFGAEALMRWNSDELGSVQPDRFISLAEETGLIHSLGQFALDRACRDALAWPEWMMLAVNVSTRQFQQPNFAEWVTKMLARTRLPPKRLELEITESLLLDHSDTVDKAISDLKALGVHFSIDDFGTGYSSISYLRRLPFSTLKIDRSFVSELPLSKADCELVRSIIAMASSLGLSIVGEGVEDSEQWSFLKESGCKLGQGYLFSRPVKASAFSAWLAKENPLETKEYH